MNLRPAPTAPATLYLSRHQGRIACDIDGAGPLIVLAPGMGERRQAYRSLAPALRQNAVRVASVDLRGHCDSKCGRHRRPSCTPGSALRFPMPATTPTPSSLAPLPQPCWASLK
jgi:alpha-beta hydrolase superfamily lysophospholipase